MHFTDTRLSILIIFCVILCELICPGMSQSFVRRQTRIAEALKQRLEEVAASALDLDTATRLDAGKTRGSYW
jgi:hypothetical protein